ncbi:phosphohistidine phosphatase SixA [bacterium]|nr:phosphohistidine phosphatase SixA [bacterium]
MYLLLMRHGQAEERTGPGGRPLSEKGRQESARAAGIVTAVHGAGVSAVYHSVKLRAAQTAGLLAAAMSPEPPCRESDFLLPLDDVTVWASRLEAAADDIALVGHMPFMAELSMYLLHQAGDYRSVQLRTAQIVCLRRTAHQWEWQWTVTP